MKGPQQIGWIIMALLPFSLGAQVTSSSSTKAHMIAVPKKNADGAVSSVKLEITVVCSQALKVPLSFGAKDINVTYGTNKTALEADSYIDSDGVVPLAGNPNAVSFSLVVPSDLAPSSSADTFTIAIQHVQCAGQSSPTSSLSASGTIYSKANIGSLVKSTQAALAVTKTTQEKDLFAGLNISVPSSNSGDVSGDLAYNYSVTSLPNKLQNSPLYDSGNVALHLEKGSSPSVDARHLDLGLSARKTILFVSRDDLQTLQSAIANAGTNAVPSMAVLKALDRTQNRFLKAAIFDYGFQMETDVSTQGIGAVSNALADIRPQIATGAFAFTNDKGYLSLRLMPIGTELGHNISKPSSSSGNVGGLIRAKSGGDINLFYKNSSDSAFIQKIQLDADGMYRYLFERETAYDSSTSMTNKTAIGSHFWVQSNLTIFSSKTYGKVKPGLKLSYQDGALPPVFNKVHSFTYGIVFESTDD